MLGEIDRDFYCLIDAIVKNEGCSYYGCGIPSQATKTCSEAKCGYHRHKHPTPEQFKEEYGREWEGATYKLCLSTECGNEQCPLSQGKHWTDIKHACMDEMEELDEEGTVLEVCACTPWGIPENGWRPE